MENKKITLKEMQDIQLNILKYIEKICSEHNIDYFLIAGTLLGAIRHNGFIPWDDDIDIALTRKNYEKLLNVLKNEKHDYYILMDNSINDSYFYPFAKVIDTRTILIEKSFNFISNYGVYIDIFSFQGMPTEKRLQDKHYKKIKATQRLIFYNSQKRITDKNIIKLLIKKLIVLYAKILGTKRILKKYDKVCTKYDIYNSDYALINWPVYKQINEIQKAKNYLTTEYHKFESMQAKIPINYDEILTTTYGNYMILPPKEKRTKHNNEAYWKEK